jgi:hypothetical protein
MENLCYQKQSDLEEAPRHGHEDVGQAQSPSEGSSGTCDSKNATITNARAPDVLQNSSTREQIEYEEPAEPPAGQRTLGSETLGSSKLKSTKRSQDPEKKGKTQGSKARAQREERGDCDCSELRRSRGRAKTQGGKARAQREETGNAIARNKMLSVDCTITSYGSSLGPLVGVVSLSLGVSNFGISENMT